MGQRFFFVDVEAAGATPVSGVMTEFGIVELVSKSYFHGKLWYFTPDPVIPAIPVLDYTRGRNGLQLEVEYSPVGKPGPVEAVHAHFETQAQVMSALVDWIGWFGPARTTMFSDNPAYDFMWMACAFDDAGLKNPFGHSARRIGDLYAGLTGNWMRTSDWKNLRVTKHTHNPVDDSMGNAEAFEQILKQYGQTL